MLSREAGKTHLTNSFALLPRLDEVSLDGRYRILSATLSGFHDDKVIHTLRQKKIVSLNTRNVLKQNGLK
jgi:hypothetical protein